MINQYNKKKKKMIMIMKEYKIKYIYNNYKKYLKNSPIIKY